MKTLAERLDEEEKALDEEESFRLRIEAALKRSAIHVAAVRKQVRKQLSYSRDDWKLVIR